MMCTYLTYLRDNKHFFPKTILDVGANVGNFTKTCKIIWPLSKFIMVEGNKECAFPLSMIGQTYYIELLGEEDGKKVIFYKTTVSPTNTGNSIYKENTLIYSDEKLIKEERKLIKLDTLLKDSTLMIDFAKLDTQGSELDIIKGGIKTLKNCKYILIEVSLKYYNEGIPLKHDIVNFMSSIGFSANEIVEQHIWASSEQVSDIKIGEVFQEDIMFFKD